MNVRNFSKHQLSPRIVSVGKVHENVEISHIDDVYRFPDALYRSVMEVAMQCNVYDHTLNVTEYNFGFHHGSRPNYKTDL